MIQGSTLAISDSSNRNPQQNKDLSGSSYQPRRSQLNTQPSRNPTGVSLTFPASSTPGSQKNHSITTTNDNNKQNNQLRHSLSSLSSSSSSSNRQISASTSPTSSFNSALSSPSASLTNSNNTGTIKELSSKLKSPILSSADNNNISNIPDIHKTSVSFLRSMSSMAPSSESVHEPFFDRSNNSNYPNKSSHSTTTPTTATALHTELSQKDAIELPYKNPQGLNTCIPPNCDPVVMDFSLNGNKVQPSTTPPPVDHYPFDTDTLKHHSAFVSPGNSHSTTTARSSNNDSFSSASISDSPVSSAIHDDSNNGSNGNTSPHHMNTHGGTTIPTTNNPVTATTNNTTNNNENFPLPAEPGQTNNALKHRKSCGSIRSNSSSHHFSLNHKASISSFSKSFSRPLSNSRPSSIHNEPTTASTTTTSQTIASLNGVNEPLGIAIDRPPEGFAQNPTVQQNPDNPTNTTSPLDSANDSPMQNFSASQHRHRASIRSKSPLSSPSISSVHDVDPLAQQKPYDVSQLQKNETKPELNTLPSSSNLPRPQKPRPEYFRTVSSSSSTSRPNFQPLPTQNSILFKHHSLPTNDGPHSPGAIPLTQQPLQRGSASSASRNSIGNYQDNNRASGLQRNSSITFLRRRSMLPQNMASAPTEARTGYYKEQVKAMRELKRRRQEFEQDDQVLVGKTISEGHINYSIAYNMLTGIRVSVSRCNAKVDRELTDSDFTARHKLAFDISGNELIPSSKYDFKFKDYAPLVFRHLRALFQLDPADYLMSLTNKYILSELSSPGKSGSLFYYSRDYRFIIKTIHHSEHKTLRKILKEYYNHVKTNPNTLISRFYGLHRIKLPWGKKVHFIVMNNLFPPYYDLRRTYDLKGSTLGREYIPRDSAAKSTAVLKDLNWIKNKENLSLGPAKSKQFLGQLELDVKLLKKLNVMDYSLLIGVYDFEKADSSAKPQSVYVVEPAHGENLKGKELRKAVNATSPTEMTTLDIDEYRYGDRNFIFYSDQGGFQSTDENDQPLSEIYFLGVIDCLTPYTFFKRVETFWKGLQHNRSSISAIPSSEYGDRFFNFMKSTIKGKKAHVKIGPSVADSSVVETDSIKVAQAGADEQVFAVSVKGIQGPSGMTAIPGIPATVTSPIKSTDSGAGLLNGTATPSINNTNNTANTSHNNSSSTSSSEHSESKPGKADVESTSSSSSSEAKALSHINKGIIPFGSAPASTPAAALDAKIAHE